MKKMNYLENYKEDKPEYKRIEKNIYKTGNRYRIRVGTNSAYESTLVKARKMKKLLSQNNTLKVW